MKALVRFNPDGDRELNRRQLERLRALSDWLGERDRELLFELLVPPEPEQLRWPSAATATASTPSCGRSSCGAR